MATEAEGPGLRYALWVQGCPLRCDGCCNPGMLPFVRATELTVGEVAAELCSTPLIDGVTFLGGEPFAQAEPLARVAHAARERGLSVLVFSGYTIEELRAPDRRSWTALLAETDLLVDGRYQAGNPAVLRFVGSANQRLHALTGRGAALAREFERGPDLVEVRIDGASAPVLGSSVPPVRGVSVTMNGTPDGISICCEPRSGDTARKA
ncbi:MAG TPA: 4Fe-4S single cluster domain-containing protein [Anaeromyxobacteraceae bacterium]|nr:4Fe-4S single cluster domain-containing protein [Anaeromyxobacteraceae bacterium]